MANPFRCLLQLALLGYSFAILAAQNSSLPGTAHPSSLPWGEINVVVLTDDHSWAASHAPEEPYWNADYSMVLSFYEYLADYAKRTNKTLFFVMNGDFMDGTGLTTHPPKALIKLLKFMPWSAINVGNHELYKNDTVQSIVTDLVPDMNGRYLTSNVLLAETKQPMGNRYTVLTSPTGTAVLTFGFLYNFMGNTAITIVEKVEGVVESQWFLDALHKEKYDAIMVLAHMDLRDRLVFVILEAIRNVAGPTMPVQFITGHTHYRGYHVLDDAATSFEAGRYLDTVGFASFPKKTTTKDIAKAFGHSYLDANIGVLANTVNLTAPAKFTHTKNGYRCMEYITSTRKSLDLFRAIGCAPKRLYLSKGLHEPQSLWGFYRDKVVNEFLFGEILPPSPQYTRVIFQSEGGWRYDLLNGTITKDSIIAVSPFGDMIYKLASNLSASQMLDILGHKPNTAGRLPSTIVSVDSFEKGKFYELYTVSFDLEQWRQRVIKVTGQEIETPDEGVITTTDLWTQYVVKYMKECPKERSALHILGQNDHITWLFSVFLLVAVGIGGSLAYWTTIIGQRGSMPYRRYRFKVVSNSEASLAAGSSSDDTVIDGEENDKEMT